MKIDIRGLKKVSSDKKSSTFITAKGHQFIVAHKGLSAGNLKELDNMPIQAEEKGAGTDFSNVNKFAQGGGVGGQNQAMFHGVKSRIADWAGDASPAESAIDPNAETISDLTPEEEETLKRGGSIGGGSAIPAQAIQSEDIQPRRLASGGPVSGADRADSLKKLGMTKYAPAIDAAPVPADQADASTQGSVGPASTMATPVNNNEAVSVIDQNAGQPISAFPAFRAPPAAADDPYAVANSTALKGLQMQGEGAQQSAVATGELGAREASADSMAANSLNSQAAQFQKHYQDLSKERQAMLADGNNGHIDPSRFIKGMSTGNKILSGIGLVLGGLGSGMTHQPNLAFEYLSKQIDHDIDAQQKTFQNKGTLLNANFQQTQNLVQATEITRMQTLDINAMHLKTLAAAAQNPLQRAQLLTTSGQLYEKASQIQAQIAQRQALMQTYKGGQDAEQSFQQRNKLLRVMGQDKFADEAEKRHVPGVGEASREVPADVLTQITARNALNSAVEDLQHFAHQNSGSLNPAAITQGRAKAAIVQDMVRQAANAGVFKESEKEFMNRYVGEDPTQLFQKYRSGKGYEEVRKNNLLNLNALKQTYGLKVSPQESAKSQGTPEIQKRNGVSYMKVPGGWKRVK